MIQLLLSNCNHPTTMVMFIITRLDAIMDPISMNEVAKSHWIFCERFRMVLTYAITNVNHEPQVKLAEIDTLSQIFTWPQMWSQVKAFCKTSPQCQLPIKQAEADPWTEVVHVDMMGPHSVTTPSNKLSLLVFTAINPATGWFECVEVPNKESFTVMEACNNHWLCRYPRPQKIRFNNRTKFKSVFQEICSSYGL
jgi:hypothetical protein